MCCFATLILSGCGGNGDDRASQGPSTSAAKPSAPPPGRIVFRRYLDDTQQGDAVFTARSDGSDLHRIIKAPPYVIDQALDWSPDARRLLFTRLESDNVDVETRRLMIASSTGKDLKALTPSCSPHVESECGSDEGGSFSKDGRSIAFIHSQGKIVDDQVRRSDVFIMDADGRHRRQVSRSAPYAGRADGAQWSPDGKQLLFARENSPTAKPADGLALFIINRDGTKQRRLTPWSVGAGGTADWSPATNLIVFRAVVDEESGIGNFFTIRPDGTGLTQITHFHQTVVSHKVTFSPDGSWVAFGKGNGIQGDVYVARSDGSSLRRVTKTTAPEGAASSPDWAPER